MAASSDGPYERRERTVPEPQRLQFVPSEGLREIISPFYRPTSQEALAKVSLWSKAYLPAERVAGGNLIYGDPIAPRQNGGSLIARFNRQDGNSPPRHTYPILSYVQYELLDQKSRFRVNLLLGTITTDDERFAMIPGFSNQVEPGYFDAFFEISARDFTLSRALGLEAIAGLNRKLGIDNLARYRTPMAKRYADREELYAIREPGFRHSSAIDPRWRPIIIPPPSYKY